MRTALFIILLIVCLLWIGGLTVTFKPFSVSLPDWHKALGILLFWLSMLTYTVGEQTKGYKEGFDNGIRKCIEILKNDSQSKTKEI